MTFPTDDVTLGALEAACQVDAVDGQSHLFDFLNFHESHQNDVILSLIAEVRRLRGTGDD